MRKLLIGWSEANITPEKKVSLEGQFAERISEYVEKPLTATAMAMESAGEQVVFVSCDLVHITAELLDGIRAVWPATTWAWTPARSLSPPFTPTPAPASPPATLPPAALWICV